MGKAREEDMGRRRVARQEVRQEAEEMEKKRKRAMVLLAKGQVGKAVRVINSFGLGSMEDPAVRAQMEEKYPERGRPLPDMISKGQCVDSLAGMREALLGLKTGISSGTGGMRPEFLTCLAEVWGEEPMRLLEQFSIRYLMGEFPPWWYRVWLTVMTVPLYKTVDQDTIRPVGVRPQLSRQIHKMVHANNKGVLRTFFEPQQLAFSEAGGAKLVQSVRMLSEANEDFIVIKMDIKNAFNSVSRARVLEVMEQEESLRHLVWHAAQTLAPPCTLESGGRRWGEACEGTTQGDPESSDYFSIAWHPQVRELDSTLARVGGAAKAGMDDLYAVRPAEIVFPAVEKFWREVEIACLLTLQRDKTEIFSWTGQLPPGSPEGLRIAGTEVEGRFEPGYICYGIPVGTRPYVRHHLRLKVEQVAREVEEVCRVLEGEGQAIWSIARMSTAQKLDYHATLCYPEDMAEAAKCMDQVLWNMLGRASGLHIPRVDEGRGVECCPQTPVTRHQGCSLSRLAC